MKLKIIKISSFLLVFIVYNFGNLFAQQTTTQPKIYQGIELDAAIVKAVREGFDIDGFIKKIQNDTTFYKAFKTLHLKSYEMYNDIEIFDAKGNVKAAYNSIGQQTYEKKCRRMTLKNEKVKGDFFDKKRNYNYLTAKLYADLFFTNGKKCNENNIVGRGLSKDEDKRKDQLKKLIFMPGTKVNGVPGVGDKVGIFDKEEREKYKFTLEMKMLGNENCYVFSAKPKPGFEKKVVINRLNTWFRISDNAILARDYSLSYRTLVYDFDVDMKVKLKQIGKDLVPFEIKYNGNWKVAFKDREKSNFTAIFTNFL